MQTVRILAGFLFYLTRIIGVLYLVTCVYTAIVLSLVTATDLPNLPIRMYDNRFEILYPFTETPFLLGEWTRYFIIMMLGLLLVYGLFFWLLSNVFNSFRKTRLFTPKAVKRLRLFYVFNFVLPIAMLLFSIFTNNQDVQNILTIGMLHIILGVFAFFMAAILRQGLVLQEEQDLTL